MFDLLVKRLDELLNQWWALPSLILAWLVFIPPKGLKSRPQLYWPVVVTTALVPVCFFLLPGSFLVWGLLPLGALLLLVVGLPAAHTFRHPDFFRIGIIATALGLICFLLLPWYLASIAITELEVPLLILGLFISGCVLAGGVRFISMADKKDFADPF